MRIAAPRGRVDLFIGRGKLHITNRRLREDGQTELTFRVPGKSAEGCYVPVHVAVNGKLLPDSIPVAISSTDTCRPPPYQPSNAWLSGKTGIAARLHGAEWSLENQAAHTTVDVVTALFDGDAAALRPGPLLRFPPPGLCSSESGTYAPGTPPIEMLLPKLFEEVTGVELDGGPSLNLNDGRYQVVIPKVVGHTGLFWKTIASTRQELEPIETKGDLHLRAPGGHDVNSFFGTLPSPPTFEWTNRPQSPIFPTRTQRKVSWNTPAPGVVLLALVGTHPTLPNYRYCLCVAPAASQQFEIPWQLAETMIPGDLREAAAGLYLVQLPERVTTFPPQPLKTTAGLSIRMVSAKVLLRR